MKKSILCRDLTGRYHHIRKSYFSTSLGEDDDGIELNYYTPSSNLKNGALTDEEQGNDDQFDSNSAPLWYKVLTNVKTDIDSIKKFMEQLSQMHKQHCTFSVKKSNNFAEEEREIEILTDDIKRLFVRSKQFIERIVLPAKPTSQEDIIKKNTKSALVMELNELSKAFREQQQDYLQKLKALKQRRQNVMIYKDNGSGAETLEQKQFDPGFTDEQIKMLIDNEMENIRRDKELREILTSIVELNELFKEFSSLVVEQGTLLDRIDRNIEATFEHVSQGNKELEQSEKYQKCGAMALAILILGVVLLLAIIALVLKFVITFAVPF
ncbi:predicted protein [Naegleria gruberi]|uniref:Predicted protein n=1 Tax=Naegleria gruberi TaxID=5762 RepID=D2UZX9_NAEGR|nr:uncharacterized protein NAEGRDRAFT_34956 [Naegleria gruberi]EFC50239.1 predicted protein [Naegleria gruberi]|eukprot:XP_002682983.1 predicted protein [Naegleria gruberi strain NEG-M]